MKRFVLIPVLGFGLQACAVMDMPESETSNPSWVEERRDADGEGLTAPATVPSIRMDPAVDADLDAQAERILQRRADLMAEDAAAEDGRPDTDSFVATAHERTSPPDIK